jgi:pimeloyl-ACP methyl ester carboxylesterase
MANAAQLQNLAQKRAIKKQVLIAGISTDYWLYPASDNAKNAKNILLVHGYRGDHHGLESFAGGLEEFNVYAPDLPGFGSSKPLATEHNLENYVLWLASFVKAVGLEGSIAIGHSFGTLIIASVQSKEALFSKLVCINPVAGGITKGLSRLLMQFVKFYYFAAHKLPEKLGMKMVTSFLLVDSMSAYTTKSKDKALRKWVKGQHRMHFNSFANSHVVWEAYIASVSHVIHPFMREINVPVLFIAAELDEVTPVEEVVKLAKSLPQAQIQVVSNCGHLVHYEAAQQTVDWIREFVGQTN